MTYTKLRNDPKRTKTFQNEPKGGVKRSETSQKETAKMTQNNPKRAKTIQNGPRGDLKPAKTTQNDPKHSKTSQKET